MNKAVLTPTLGERKVEYLRIVSDKIGQNQKLPLLLTLFHIPLGIVLYNAGAAGIIYPLIVFLIGMRRALLVEEKLERVAQVVAYIVGIEVLLRMAETPVPWEFGKLFGALLMITALVRRKLWTLPVFALFYFILLLPSCFITVSQFSLSEAKAILSSNLSGPFMLLVSCWFFSQLTLDQTQIKKLFLAAILPLTSVAVTTLFYTVTAAEIEFGGESNFATSGGFGPNQVSSMLGLGAFLCIAAFLLFKNSFHFMLYFGALALLFTAQSVLTFSRGGMYNAVAATLLIILCQIRNFKDGIRRLLPVAGIALIFLLVIFPYLDNFTGGALQERFDDKNPTKRGEIVETDFKIFAANPVLGVGMGNAYEERGKYLEYKAMTHTEFGRMFAEHGTFGLLSLLSLMLLAFFNYRKQETDFGKALVAGLVTWSVMFMLNAGMRLAAPSFIWGMTYLIVTNLPARKNPN